MEDGATIKNMLLFNMLAAIYGYEPAVLTVHDVSEHLVSGRKKDTSQILDIFRQQMKNWFQGRRNLIFILLMERHMYKLQVKLLRYVSPGFL